MSIAIVLILLAAVAGSAAMGIVLTVLFMRQRDPALGSGGPRDLLTLQEQLRRLAEELDTANADIEQLRQRLDFTERLLGSGEPSPPEDSNPSDLET
jgi:hypothetical protein